MSAVQFVPKDDARPGDRVREVGCRYAIEQMPEIVRLDGGSGVFVREPSGERFVAFDSIDVIIRVVRLGP